MWGRASALLTTAIRRAQALRTSNVIGVDVRRREALPLIQALLLPAGLAAAPAAATVTAP
jgi:hypothetical protein